MSSKGGWLEAIHLYRKVPRDLTDATALGGVLSMLCAVTMAYLFVSNIAEYMSMTTRSDVALDDTGDVHMRLFFNITMERLPCQFATVDLADAMGTSLTNVTAEIIKFRVGSEAGTKQEFYVEEPHAVKHEELDEHELMLYKTMPENVPFVRVPLAPPHHPRSRSCTATQPHSRTAASPRCAQPPPPRLTVRPRLTSCRVPRLCYAPSSRITTTIVSSRCMTSSSSPLALRGARGRSALSQSTARRMRSSRRSTMARACAWPASTARSRHARPYARVSTSTPSRQYGYTATRCCTRTRTTWATARRSPC